MVFDPLSITAITALITTATPHMLEVLRGTLLDKGKEVAIDKSQEFLVDRGSKLVRDRLHLDDKEQQKHLEQALKNALERGLTTFQTLLERDQYRDILKNLFEPGEHSAALRQEALRLFSFSDKPDLAKLNEAYNRSLRSRNLSTQEIPVVDAAPYLDSFFQALTTELYADPFFKQQMSDAVQVRAALATISIQTSAIEIVALLRQMGTILANDYTAEQLEKDIQIYATHLEGSLRYLKIAGVVPTKDRSDRHRDPELNGIFVPLRIDLKETRKQEQVKPLGPYNEDGEENASGKTTADDETTELDAIKTSLEQFPYLVLLGGPGSGKSTVTRYIAWSHAAASCTSLRASDTTLLARRPLPLRIELRRLVEDRRRQEYDFLSYATEVILKREGVEIHPQMFKELLARKSMVLLFDGLDEVPTLDERRRLVEEIEGFVLRYPGNYVLVTSRPVGYELAPISNQWFAQAEVQEFDDAQIRQFLERWYSHVLRLSPLPSDDRQELEVLYKTLRNNPRLHKLAVNPLLLTVITALHRYEHLPDKRILVYDRCADLLLDTWARLKGTDARWQKMRMSKDDQYACVAHLGYVLHTRSQEQANENEKNQDKDTDVPSWFLVREIEHFLNKNGLLKEVAEQRAEAKRFLELMQVEAGLIVERGTGENDEALYGFVHRTFQEYFAAADVYERYKQDEEREIINEFLVQHLHDPHWQEVILLLLGKLGRKPLTARLQQILDSKIVSHRSQHTDILQQDLFFVSSCLEEELIVEPTLAEKIVKRIVNIANVSPLLSQRNDAIEHLSTLIQSRQYPLVVIKELLNAITQNTIGNIDTNLQFAILLNSYSSLEIQGQVEHIISAFVQQSNFLPDQMLHTVQKYYQSNGQSKKDHLIMAILFALAQRLDLSIRQQAIVISYLLNSSSSSFKMKRFAKKMLTNLLQHSNLSTNQRALVAYELYDKSIEGSKLEKDAIHMILSMAPYSNISVEQGVEIAKSLYHWNEDNNKKRKLATQILLSILAQPNISTEHEMLVAQIFIENGFSFGGEERGVQILTEIFQLSNTSFEQKIEIISILTEEEPYDFGVTTNTAIKMLFKLAEDQNLTLEQQIAIAQGLWANHFDGSVAGKEANSILFTLVNQSELSLEQTLQVAETIYVYNDLDTDEHRFAVSLLMNIAQRTDHHLEQILQATLILYQSANYWNEIHLKGRLFATPLLVTLAQRHTLSARQTLQIANELSESQINTQEQRVGAQLYASLLQQEELSINDRNSVYESLRGLVPQFDKLLTTTTNLA